MIDDSSRFVIIDGSSPLYEVADLVAAADKSIVVRVGGTYWVCTPNELREIVEMANPNAQLSTVMFEIRPAMVIRAGTAIPGDRRVVVTDGIDITAISTAGGLEHDLAMATPASPPEELADSERDSIEAPQNLGPSRGIAEESTSTPDEAAAESEPWSLETRFPREVGVGTLTSLTVALTRQPGQGPDVSTLPVELAAGTPVGVLIQVGRGFEVVGPSEGIVEASDEALPIRFQLRALEVGLGHVRILFFVESTALGVITLEPAILGEDDDVETSPVPSSTVLSALDVGSAAPDLEIVVLEETSNGQPAYSIRITSKTLGYHLREFGPIVLRTDARSYFAELFTEIEGLALVTPEDRSKAQALLEVKGDALFRDLIPGPLGEQMWQARDRITRIRIDSEEPHIPWELIRLSGPDDSGNIVSGRFLCEYEMTRWIPGPALHQNLGMTSFGVVVPPESDLVSAQKEKEFLTGLSGPRRSVTEVPATFTDVMAAFTEGRHDVWHFAGHGVVKAAQDPNRFAIHLDDGDRFTPDEVSGPRANVGKPAPLIFLNACQVGQGGMSLTGLGGWAQQFLQVGAAGFVGAIWNVHDNPAREFARSFYTSLLAGNTIGAATLGAREEIKRYQDATWLAYTVYGHPSATVALVEEDQ
jgi:hypothetical protein